MPFLPPNQQRQSTEGKKALKATEQAQKNMPKPTCDKILQYYNHQGATKWMNIPSTLLTESQF